MSTLTLLMPELSALGVLLVLVLGEIFGKKEKSDFAWIVAFAGGFLTLASLAPLFGKTLQGFGGMFLSDAFAVYFKAYFTAAMLGLLLVGREFFQGRLENSAEFLLVLWTSLLGLFFLASANDLLLFFIALEVMTLSLYILAAYLKRDMGSIEAGLKYLLLGSVASAFVIYGISLLYTVAGSTGFSTVRIAFEGGSHHSLMLLGLVFVISGVGFKIASVPFHLWVPDVYEGAPVPATAYLAIASKAAGFAILMRLLFTVFGAFAPQRTVLFSVLAAMTMVYGNLGALLQTNLKRLFGYSSITHAGYLMIGLAAGLEGGVSAVLFYLLAYGMSNLAAFLVITIAGRELKTERIQGLSGLGRRSPFLAASFFVAILSLAGVPPMAGFFGKFLVLLSAVREDLSWLALLGLVGVAVSLFYYLSLVRVMYFEEPASEDKIAVSLSSRIALIVLVAGMIGAGLFQAPFLAFATAAAHSLF